MRCLIVLVLAIPTPLHAAQQGAGDQSAAGPGIFVAVGYGGLRGWSLHGDRWAAERWSAKNEDDDNIIFSIAYRAGVFVAAGGGASKGFVLRSVDGKAWAGTAAERHRICQVIALDDRFVATGEDTFLISTDGATWTAGGASRPVSTSVPGDGHYRRSAAAPDGVVVYAGDYSPSGPGRGRMGWIGSTKQGVTALTISTWPADICGLVHGGKRFVACGVHGQVLASDDGTVWKEVLQTRDAHDDGALRYGNGAFWLSGRTSVHTSPDGVSWTSVANEPHLPRATSPDGVGVDCGWDGIEVSGDGRTWTRAEVPIDATGVSAVVWGIPQEAP